MARSNEPHGNDRIHHDDDPVASNREQPANVQGRQPASGSEAGRRPSRHDESDPGATRVRGNDDTGRDSFVGTDRGFRGPNASWGAIFAGTVTFLAVALVFGLISTAMGLTEVDGVAIGILSIVGILLALAAGGFVAGALAVRAGLLHGLVTWATSLVGVILLIGWLGASVLGALGGAVGGVAETVEPEMVQEELEAIDEEDVDEATEDAEGTADDVQDDAAAGTWWGVAGLIIGAAVAGFAGVAGAKSAHTRSVEADAGARRR